jgi:hypothetical protein
MKHWQLEGIHVTRPLLSTRHESRDDNLIMDPRDLGLINELLESEAQHKEVNYVPPYKKTSQTHIDTDDP